MKTKLNLLAAGLFLAASSNALASTTLYVDVNSANPTPPYASWATAAKSIQVAVNVAAAGDQILVTNGVYPGGVTVTQALMLLSVKGPQFTAIKGGGPCISLTDGASLSGFTLTNGNGGFAGGGAYGGTLYNCTLTGNSADLGGGANNCTLYNCTLTSNSAKPEGGPGMWNGGHGGGAYNCTLYNCTLTGNSALFEGPGTAHGGGACSSTLYNCTLTGNSTEYGAGAFECTLNNCVVYYNGFGEIAGGTLNYCCVPMLGVISGVGNITNAPLFVDQAGGNLRLQMDSPCINAGDNSYVIGTTDLDGNPRIVGGMVDIGAYEFQGTGSVISYAWLQQYGLPTDGSADFADPDHDGLNNWQEWRCGTCPTNALSVLQMLSVTNAVSGVTVSWQSVAGVNYLLERSTNLGASAPTFTRRAIGIPGQPGTTTFTDTNAVGAGPFFYRVGVSTP